MGSQVATPPAGKGAEIPMVLASGRLWQCGSLGAGTPARAPGSASQEAALGGSTVPSAVRMLLFQQCRQETIQGNDYYIILKEYGLEKAEAALSRVLPSQRQVALQALLGKGRGAPGSDHAAARQALWVWAGRRAPHPLSSQPVLETIVCRNLCFALSSNLYFHYPAVPPETPLQPHFFFLLLFTLIGVGRNLPKLLCPCT